MRARHQHGRRKHPLKGEMGTDLHERKHGGRAIHGEGSAPRERHDRSSRARGGTNWIAGAIKHPGALHRSLGVPEGQKIPAKKLAKAARSSNPTMRRRAALAKTLKHMH